MTMEPKLLSQLQYERENLDRAYTEIGILLKDKTTLGNLLENLSQKYNELEKESQEQINVLKGRVATQTDRADQLSAALDACRESRGRDNQDFTRLINDKDSEIYELRTMLGKHTKSSIQRLENELECSRKDNRNMRVALTEARKEVEAVKHCLEIERTVPEELRKQLDVAHTHLVEAHQTLDEKQAEIKGLMNRIDYDRVELERMRRYQEQLKEELRVSKEIHRDLNDQLKALEVAHKFLQETTEQEIDRVVALNAKVNKDAISRVSEERKKYKDEVKALREQIVEMNKTLDQREERCSGFATSAFNNSQDLLVKESRIKDLLEENNRLIVAQRQAEFRVKQIRVALQDILNA